MRVRVLYFASLRERAGSSSSEEDVAQGTTAADLWAVIRARPAFASVPASPGFSLNGEWTDPGRVLGEGDEVGLLPPVSGG